MSISKASSSSPTRHLFFARSRLLLWLSLLGLVGLGLGLRLFDLTDPPLDFVPWRQLRAASIARGMYYERLPTADPEIRFAAIALGNLFEVLEPRIFESLVARTYLIVGGEYLWIARLYAILFWMVGGLALYQLARRLTSHDGALVSLTFYLIVPFGVTGSRSFLPEPLMVMWILLSAYSLYRWAEEHTWKWAILTGICSGLAILIKVFAVYPLAAATIGVLLSIGGVKRTLRNPQVWIVAILAGLIPASYYLFGTSTTSSASEYLKGWVVGFLHLLLQPGFYIRWLSVLDSLVNLPILFASMLGIFLLPRKGRELSLGLWLGYGILGLSLPSLILSHIYYSLVLIPIIALSLSSLGDLIFSRFSQLPKIWQALLLGVVFASIAYPTVINRNALVARDFHLEAAGWKKLGNQMPKDGNLIGLTHDYDTRLNYYGWTAVTHWAYVSDLKMAKLGKEDPDLNDPAWQAIFERVTDGYDYFVVTLMNELEAQPVLKATLYENYEIFAESQNGEKYVIFDLNKPKR